MEPRKVSATAAATPAESPANRATSAARRPTSSTILLHFAVSAFDSKDGISAENVTITSTTTSATASAGFKRRSARIFSEIQFTFDNNL